jgi:hypothetical protein
VSELFSKILPVSFDYHSAASKHSQIINEAHH